MTKLPAPLGPKPLPSKTALWPYPRALPLGYRNERWRARGDGGSLTGPHWGELPHAASGEPQGAQCPPRRRSASNWARCIRSTHGCQPIGTVLSRNGSPYKGANAGWRVAPFENEMAMSIVGLFRKLAGWQRDRDLIRALASSPDRELEDIGMIRGDIRDAVCGRSSFARVRCA
jgi:uncharacterized protein YjiS (DUF1127 family)